MCDDANIGIQRLPTPPTNLRSTSGSHRVSSKDSLTRAVDMAKLRRAENEGEVIDLTSDDEHIQCAHASDEEAALESTRLLRELLVSEVPAGV